MNEKGENERSQLHDLTFKTVMTVPSLMLFSE